MASGTTIKATKGGPKNVPTPPERPQLVLGSRPASMRSGAVPRIKPAAANTTQYGKAVGQPNPAGVAGQWPGAGGL